MFRLYEYPRPFQYISFKITQLLESQPIAGPSCLTPRSKWHSFTNMDILCFYSVLHNVSIMTCETGALHQCAIVSVCQCVTVSVGRQSPPKLSVLVYCHGIRCTSAKALLMPSQQIRESTQRNWLMGLFWWGTPYFTSCPLLPITNRSQSAQHCMSGVKAVQNQVP